MAIIKLNGRVSKPRPEFPNEPFFFGTTGDRCTGIKVFSNMLSEFKKHVMEYKGVDETLCPATRGEDYEDAKGVMRAGRDQRIFNTAFTGDVADIFASLDAD